MTNAAALPVSISNIWSKLVGLGPWRRAAAALSSPDTYDDAKVERLIPAMLRKFERETQFLLSPRQVSTKPDGSFPDTANRRLVRESPYHYYNAQVGDYFSLRLRQRPVVQVQRMRVMIGDQLIYRIPASWFSLDPASGTLFILPTYGSLFVAASANALLLLGSGFQDYIPNGIQVDYIAGLQAQDGSAAWWLDPYSEDPDNPGEMDPESVNPQYADLVRHLEEWCALEVLYDIAQLADAGLRSVSMSGGAGGESLSYTRFEDRKAELEKRRDDYLALYKDQESPVLLGVLGI